MNVVLHLIELYLLGIILYRQHKQNQQLKGYMSQLDEKIADLTVEVSENTTVIGSAVELINGFGDRLQAAIDAALAAGATETQLTALTDLKGALDTNEQSLAAAVAANTPPPPPIP